MARSSSQRQRNLRVERYCSNCSPHSLSKLLKYRSFTPGKGTILHFQYSLSVAQSNFRTIFYKAVISTTTQGISVEYVWEAAFSFLKSKSYTDGLGDNICLCLKRFGRNCLQQTMANIWLSALTIQGSELLICVLGLSHLREVTLAV